MYYPDLAALLRDSRSARAYFLSLPVAQQLQLHEHNAYIHSAAQLRLRSGQVEAHSRAVALSESLDFRFTPRP